MEYESRWYPVDKMLNSEIKQKEYRIANHLRKTLHLNEEDMAKETKKEEKKVKKVMGEFKEGKLHSGSKKGPMVKDKRQAVAIAMSEAGMKKKKK